MLRGPQCRVTQCAGGFKFKSRLCLCSNEGEKGHGSDGTTDLQNFPGGSGWRITNHDGTRRGRPRSMGQGPWARVRRARMAPYATAAESPHCPSRNPEELKVDACSLGTRNRLILIFTKKTKHATTLSHKSPSHGDPAGHRDVRTPAGLLYIHRFLGHVLQL